MLVMIVIMEIKIDRIMIKVIFLSFFYRTGGIRTCIKGIQAHIPSIAEALPEYYF